MTIGRQAWRTALLLACSTGCLTALSPSASSQAPPPVENPQATAAQADDPQSDSDDERRRERRRARAADREATDRDAGDQPRARIADEEDVARPKVWLGLTLKEISGDLAAYLGDTKGVLVESVFPDSPAKEAGIQAGDIVIKINGQSVESPQALIEVLLKLDQEQAGDADQQDSDRRKRTDRAQKRDDDGQSKEGEQPDREKRDGEQQPDSDKKDVTYQPVKLTLLRQGKEITVEVTPSERPESLAVEGSEPNFPSGRDIPGLERMLEELELPGGGRAYRFAPRPPMAGPFPRPFESPVHSFVIVIRDASGDSIEVRIERAGDEPAKITVREGDKIRRISEDEIDQLPEKVRDAVREALEGQERARDVERSRRATRDRFEGEMRERLERGQRDMREAARQRMEANRRMREQFRDRPDDSDASIFDAEELRKLGQSAQELAARYQQMAEEMARRGVDKAQELAALPEELKQLRAQVDQLTKQVEELKAQLEAKEE